MDMAKPKIRFKGYTDEWEQRKLGEHCEMYNGDRSSKYPNAQDRVEEGIPFINAGDLENGHVNLAICNKISREKYNDLGGAKLQLGDIVYCLRGTLGKNAYIDNFSEGTVASSLVVIRPKNINGRFMFHILNSDIEYRQRIVHDEGAAQPNLSAKNVAGFLIPVPHIDEQKKISEYFDNIDHLITLHQRKAICTKNVRNNHILSIFLWERAVFMGKMILYHGSPNKMIHPIYGLGEDKHDYGRGFYLTANIELAKEWAVCRPDQSNGWVHKYELVTDDLGILDFQQLNVLSWLAELMKHREASDSKRYRMLAAKFIEKYGIDTDGYDVIKGWRADASYFYIAKAFVRDEIDVDILEELLFLGDLGIQYCIKSEKGYANLHELESELLSVPFADFNDKYNERDIAARENMRKLIDSDANKVTKVFSTLI